MSNHEIATQAEAQEFARRGMAEMDKLLIGEEEAKMGSLVGMAARVNVAMVGEPGGGKTTLAGNAYRLIQGLDESHLATIPPLSDLKPQALVGGETVVTRTVNGEETTEKTEIEPIINQDTRFIWADEISRTSPFAVNAMLSAHESGVLMTTAGTVSLRGLIGAYSTMNPGESRQGTFGITKATASRHGVGVVLGNGADGQINTVHEVLGGWTPSPEDVQPVVSVEKLQAIRNRILHSTAFPEDLKSQAANHVLNSVRHLGEAGYRESSPRIARQVSVNARAIAALNGQEAVNEQDVRKAVRFVVGARVGMLASRNASDAVKEVADTILG